MTEAQVPVAGDVVAWRRLGLRLQAGPGVHRPSSFSAALAALLPDLRGRTVVDAGCGAGLVTLAALSRGAEHVIALDHDARALRDTEVNVRKVLGDTDRMSLWQAGWDRLGLLRCDLVLVNPPQRPSRLLRAVAADERHLHVGGGPDGLDGVRLILGHAVAPRVLTTGSSLLDPGPETLVLNGYGPPALLDHAIVEHDSSWRGLTADLAAAVNIWEFSRAPLLLATNDAVTH